MFRGLALAAAFAALVVAPAARAADKPVYAPPGAWTKPIPIPAAPASADGAATQLLLENLQTRFGPAGDEAFQELAVKVVTSQGMDQVGNFILPWDPTLETLTIHRLNIIRDGKVIDLLDGGKNVTILRRETNLESATLDGSLTATIQPAGLEVGDVLDLAYTTLRHDPVMQDHSVGFLSLARPGSVAHAYFRAIWPRSKPIQWKVAEGLNQPVVTPTADGQEAVIDQKDVRAPKPPAFAPGRFSNLANIEFSQFKDWAEVSALMQPLFAKASQLKPDSPLKAQIAAIAAASSDPKIRAGAALKLVEDKTRYVALLLNNGGYIPADADVTWSRRYGDCKAKTALLLALLHGLGIEAEAVLVDHAGADGLDLQLPMLMFDHVVVRAHIDGKAYWLDGTRQGDPDLDNLPIPYYRWVLPLTAKGSAIEPLVPPPYDMPHFESIVKLDARAGLDAPAPAHAEHIFRGDQGLGSHLLLTQAARTDVDLALKQYWRGKISWIDPKTVSFTYDEKTTTTTMIMDGVATIPWNKSEGAARDFNVEDSALGYQANFDREPGAHQDAPYAVGYPGYNRSTVMVQLPNKGAGFVVLNATTDSPLAGVRYRRQSAIDAQGVATIVASTQSLQTEFPASRAKADAEGLRKLVQYDGAIRAGASSAQTYGFECAGQDGPKIIAGCTGLLSDKTLTAGTRADAYWRRGYARAGQRDMDNALIDFDQAIRLQPDLVSAYVARGAVYATKQQYDLAIADGDMVVRLAPKIAASYLARAGFYLAKKDYAHAEADYDQAIALQPESPQAYGARAQLFETQHQWDKAIRDQDQLGKLLPDNPGTLNGRCWYRAEANQDLDAALAFCDAGLKLAPGSAAIADSRGLVHFRKGQLKEAAADYDLALKANAKEPSSLFMRGVVKRRQGDTAGGDTDIAAAKTLNSKVTQTYADLGIQP